MFFGHHQNKRGGKVKLQSMLMPLSEFDHAEKGDALHCKFASVTYLGVNRDNSNSIINFIWNFTLYSISRSVCLVILTVPCMNQYNFKGDGLCGCYYLNSRCQHLNCRGVMKDI